MMAWYTKMACQKPGLCIFVDKAGEVEGKWRALESMERVSPSSVPTLWAPLLPKSKKRAHRRWVNHHYCIFIFTIFHHHQILPNSYPPHTHLANLPTHPKNCTANDVVSHTLRSILYTTLDNHTPLKKPPVYYIHFMWPSITSIACGASCKHCKHASERGQYCSQTRAAADRRTDG